MKGPIERGGNRGSKNVFHHLFPLFSSTPHISPCVWTGELLFGMRVVNMGTSVGVRAHRTVAYIGTVVGFHEVERKWLVRNNILAKKGHPNRVDEAFMSR